jgi:hypothetical protein
VENIVALQNRFDEVATAIFGELHPLLDID